MWWVQPIEGSMLLYFVKSKNGKNFAIYCVLCQYIHLFVLLEISEMGGLQPPCHPLNPPLTCEWF